MSGQNKVSGVVLAGGMARRMDHQDKGLIDFNGHPLVRYALTALKPLTADIWISANRNQDRYRDFGYPVIDDGNLDFQGPLAGILAALGVAQHGILLVIPCDLPLVRAEHLQALLSALTAEVDITVAADGARLHPVLAALKTELRDDLRDYLDSGERKLQSWFQQHRLQTVDFSHEPDIFTNLNTAEDLRALENLQPPHFRT